MKINEILNFVINYLHLIFPNQFEIKRCYMSLKISNKIPKVYSEVVNRRTDNTKAKIKMTKGQATI